MKLGVSPKCGSNDVRFSIHLKNKDGAQWANTIPIEDTLFSMVTAPLERYVCTYCGYVESYIANSQDLQKIIEKWPRVERKEPIG
jgi:predicted nucleic-acid-binding Zn-ribbon protein